MDPERKEECGWELEFLRMDSLLDLLRLAAASNSVTVLIEFRSESLGGRVIGTFANNYGVMKPDIFSFVVYDGDEKGSFLIYKADESGEQFSFSNSITAAAGSATFPLVKLSEEPHWFSERFSKDEK